MQRNPFINADEILQIWWSEEVNGKRQCRIHESDEHRETYATVEDALEALEYDHRRIDTVSRIVRYDLDTLRGEDVTEELAAHYINSRELSTWDDHTLPLFVRESEEWEKFCEDVDPPVDLDAEYGTLRVVNGGMA